MATTYYIDFDNGHDVDNDGTTATKGNGDGPWATLDKFTENARAAGDKAIVRRGMTQAVSSDLTFTSDGTLLLPIILEADYGDAWSDETTAGQTATLIFGSKTVTFAGDISGDISVGDWIYETTEDNKLYAYEVAVISGGSNEIVTLYLPYKGAISGAGKTLEIMPANPIWNTAAGNYQANLDSDEFWKFQGIHFRGTDSNGNLELDSISYVEVLDCIFEGNGSQYDYGIKCSGSGDTPVFYVRKCRAYGEIGIYANTGLASLVEDSYFDGNSVSGNIGIDLRRGVLRVHDTEFINFDGTGNTGCLRTDASSPVSGGGTRFYLRNCLLPDVEVYGIAHASSEIARIYSEDHDQTENANKQMWGISDGNATIEKETTKVRGGGGTSSIKVTPVDNLGPNLEAGKIELFEYPIYQVKDVAATYTVYFSSDDDTDWDADPTATELYIEVEYWNHATNPSRTKLISTGTCGNFDADDSVWDTLTVTFTPLQSGVAYLRAFYLKPQEGGKSNIFYCDTLPVRS